jgi:DNA replication and repair protein RecF
MSWLKEIHIEGLRNVEHAVLQDFARFNLIEGANGAGKTSILEAIHILGLGRSFRHLKAGPLINYDCSQITVEGEVGANLSSVANYSINVVKKHRASDSLITVQGKRCQSSAELAEILPLQLVDSETFQLLQGAPRLRRQYLDWGVFHVEHRFLDEWKRCQRVLKQRNSLLRRGKICLRELDPWDSELIGLVNAITERRRQYLVELEPIIHEVLGHLWPEGLGVEIVLYQGWDKTLAFDEALWQQREKDLLQGYTNIGSHRADLKCKVRGNSVADVLSRGQLKLLASSLKIAQAIHLQRYCAKLCVFIIDDLPAELDIARRQLLCSTLESIGCQVVITCIEVNGVGLQNVRQEDLRVFHVEHGRVSNR